MNTRSTTKTFGEVELKYISVGDMRYFGVLLNETRDDREFVMKVLHHQLISSKVSLTDFKKIPDGELIKLARDFVGNEQYTFKYFKETTEAEFFTNFREALKRYYDTQVEQLRATLEPVIGSIMKIYKNFNRQYADIIKQTVRTTSYITESMREISNVTKYIRKSQLRIAESLRPVIEQHHLTARILSEVLTPQINFWQKWVEQNRALFDSYTNFWQTFQKQYRITEQEAIKILRKYKWFIAPSLSLR